MIDIIKAKKELKNYVQNYNPEDKQIKLKIAHIERTSQIAKEIAESLKLSKEDIQLAELIGLLHDIGRFEQIKNYHTFSDKDSINHGEYGAKVLFEDKKIRDFIDTSKYDEIIKTAILNHNKDVKDLQFFNEKEELHSKIIRDADKIDILYILTFEDKQVAWEKENLFEEEITDEIYREFIEDKEINYKEIKTSADKLVSHFAFIFDLNYNYSLKIIRSNNYLDKIYKRFKFNNEETDKRYKKIYTITKLYVGDSK